MNITRHLLYISIIVVCVALGGYFGYKNFSPDNSEVSPLNTLSLPDLNKNLRTGTEWLGKVVVLNHWAAWCPPCREEIPLLIEFQAQMANRGVQVLGVAHDQIDSARIFSDQVGMNYPSMVAVTGGEKLLAAHGNRASGALPYTVIFNREGLPVSNKLGILSYTDLLAMVEPLL